MAQKFKGDETELKFYNSGQPIAALMSDSKTDFFDGAYACAVLGDLLFNERRAPLANAIPQDIFRGSFSEVFDAFLVAGSFESYLLVFKKIFGDDATITFTVPAPGKLQIAIEAAGIELSNLIVRQIENDAYVNYRMIDQEGNAIMVQTIKGFQSQYELEQMLFEMVPDGIYTEITLTLGG